MYHRPNLFTGDNNSRSARAESFSNGDLSGSVRNAQSASNATLEPSVWASNSLAQMDIEVGREMSKDCPDITANINFDT